MGGVGGSGEVGVVGNCPGSIGGVGTSALVDDVAKGGDRKPVSEGRFWFCARKPDEVLRVLEVALWGIGTVCGSGGRGMRSGGVI